MVAIRSASMQAGGAGTVFGDGLLCVGGPVVRIGWGSALGGGVAIPIGHGAGAGTFHYQLWYRNNPTSFCDAAAAFNLSNGLSVVWR